MADKKCDSIATKGVHVMIQNKDLEAIVDLIKENPTEVKLTRASAIRVAIAALRGVFENIDETEISELTEFIKNHKKAA